jgi:hypothetical protein
MASCASCAPGRYNQLTVTITPYLQEQIKVIIIGIPPHPSPSLSIPCRLFITRKIQENHQTVRVYYCKFRKIIRPCVYYCSTCYKAVRVGGGEYWRTCATRDDEPDEACVD